MLPGTPLVVRDRPGPGPEATVPAQGGQFSVWVRDTGLAAPNYDVAPDGEHFVTDRRAPSARRPVVSFVVSKGLHAGFILTLDRAAF